MERILSLDNKKRDTLRKVKDIDNQLVFLTEQNLPLHSFTHEMPFPPFSKNAHFIRIKEAWLYLKHNGVCYEFRLTAGLDQFEKYLRIFYQFIEDVIFLDEKKK